MEEQNLSNCQFLVVYGSNSIFMKELSEFLEGSLLNSGILGAAEIDHTFTAVLTVI